MHSGAYGSPGVTARISSDAWSEFDRTTPAAVRQWHGFFLKGNSEDMKAYFSLGWVQYTETFLCQSHELIVQDSLA